MKTIILLVISIITINTTTQAQKKVKLEDNSNAPHFYYQNGNVSIGTDSSNVNFLTIKGTINDNQYSGVILQSNWNNTTPDKGAGQIIFQAKDDDTGGTQETFATINARTTSWTSTSDIGGYLSFSTTSNNSLSERMRITEDGKVGIGTTSTGSHKLAVEGTIGAREIKVETSGWSDFVFENDYELRTLEEVEEYINEHGHLPEIPSEAEVIENGINLGEMNAKLLQKIEELTLYLIQHDKQNKEQQERIEKLEKMNSELLEKLENQ